MPRPLPFGLHWSINKSNHVPERADARQRELKERVLQAN